MIRVQAILPRTCDNNVLISSNLKRRLSESNFVHRQNIRPALLNRALHKLKEMNPLYRDVQIDESLESVSKEDDPLLWNLLTNENGENDDLQTVMTVIITTIPKKIQKNITVKMVQLQRY